MVNPIQIYADGADLAAMAGLAAEVQGFTTNPSLMKKAGIKDYRAFARAVLEVSGGKPVSFEVLRLDPEALRREALEISAWGLNVYVKVPVVDGEGNSLLPHIAWLAERHVKVNVTAVMTAEQARGAAFAAGRGSIVSIFAGRIADTGIDPAPMVREAAAYAHELGAKVLWASVREALNGVQAQLAGADIITMTPELIAKVRDGFGADLEKRAAETVRQFQRDAEGITL